MNTKNRRHYKVEKLKSRALVDKMFAKGYTYEDISAAVFDEGEQISKSALQRYHASFEFAAEKIKRVQEQTKALVEALKENPNTEMAEVANQVMMAGLLERIAAADEEFDSLSLEKAGKLIATLERSGTGRERLKMSFSKMLTLATKNIKQELQKELTEHPDLLSKLSELVEKTLNNITDEMK